MPQRLTSRGPGAALPGHGVVLLVFVSTHTQEGPFYIFTEGFTTHSTEHFTFVHIWKREQRSSQTCASLLTALVLPAVPRLVVSAGNKVIPSEQSNASAILGRGSLRRVAWFDLCERTTKTQSNGSKCQFQLEGMPWNCTASIVCMLWLQHFLFPDFST